MDRHWDEPARRHCGRGGGAEVFWEIVTPSDFRIFSEEKRVYASGVVQNQSEEGNA